MRRRKSNSPFDANAPAEPFSNESTGLTFENIQLAYQHLCRKAERDKYAPFLYAPIWIVKRKGIYRFKPARIIRYRLLTKLWKAHIWRPRQHPLDIEQSKAWGC